MRKIKLDADDLRVESFTVREDTARKGTVRAYTAWDTCEAPCPSAGGGWSCDETCAHTCGQPASCGYPWCGTYEEHTCPNSEWICTTPEMAC